MMKRSLFGVLAALLLMGMLTGCGSGASEAPDEAPETEFGGWEKIEEPIPAEEEPAPEEAAPEEEAPAAVSMGSAEYLTGQWTDGSSMSRTLGITELEEGRYDVMITHTETGGPVTIWQFTGVFESATNSLVYEDCRAKRQVFAEDGTQSEEMLYENGTGSLLLRDDVILWRDDMEDAGASCVFRRDSAAEVYGRLEGSWYKNGDGTGDILMITGLGVYRWFSADMSQEHSGYILYGTEPFEDGTEQVSYTFFSNSGEIWNSFYDATEGELQEFTFSQGEGDRYVKVVWQ